MHIISTAAGFSVYVAHDVLLAGTVLVALIVVLSRFDWRIERATNDGGGEGC